MSEPATTLVVSRGRILRRILIDGFVALAVWIAGFAALRAAGPLTASEAGDAAVPFVLAGLGILLASVVVREVVRRLRGIPRVPVSSSPYAARTGLIYLLTWPILQLGWRTLKTTDLSAETVWIWLLVVGAVLQVGDAIPRLVRPAGYEDLRTEGSPPPLAKVGAVAGVVSGALLWGFANAQFAPGPRLSWPDVSPIPPVVGSWGWSWLVAIALGGLVAWSSGRTRLFIGLFVATYLIGVYGSGSAWEAVQFGKLTLTASAETVAVLDLAAAATFLGALAIGYTFRRRVPVPPALTPTETPSPELAPT